jgi:hypothetical protein
MPGTPDGRRRHVKTAICSCEMCASHRPESVTSGNLESEIAPFSRYVAYYRVSTGQQGRFGFSIEAQRTAVEDYITGNTGVLVAEFSETMSERIVVGSSPRR